MGLCGSVFLELGAFRDNIIGLVLAPAAGAAAGDVRMPGNSLYCDQQRPAPRAILITFMADIKDRQISNEIRDIFSFRY